jgi:hypothetical protein
VLASAVLALVLASPLSPPVTLSSSPQVGVVPGVPAAFSQCVAFRESTDGLLSSDLYGFLQSTWSGLGLPGSPYYASVGLQNFAFSELYAQMGTQPWAPYDGC